MAKNKSGNKKTNGGGKGTSATKVEGNGDHEKAKTRADAEEIVNAGNEAAAAGEPNKAETGADEAVAEVRAEQQADNSVANVLAPMTPTDRNAIMDDADDEDNEDEDGMPAQPDHVARNILEVATALPRDEDATAGLSAKEVAKAVGIKPRSVTGFAVRGDDVAGRYLIVTTHDGRKLAVAK